MSSDGHFFMMDEEAFFYVNMGTDASPSWTLMNYAEEVIFDLSKSDVELPFGESKFKLYRGGDFDAPFSFKYSRPKPGIVDAIHDKIYDSFVNHTPVQFAWTDLPIADANAIGFSAWCEVMKYPMKKTSEENQMLEIEAKPTDYCEADTLVLPELLGSS